MTERVKRGVLGRGSGLGRWRLRCGHEVTFPAHKGNPPPMLPCPQCSDQRDEPVATLDNRM